MFGPKTKLFEIFGFEVKLDTSWFFLALLVSWSLAQGYFPSLYEGLPKQTYWSMGIIGAIGIFFSIIFHELSHSLVARRYGMNIRGITLFIFGGVAEMGGEPPTPRAEFMMAIAGPIASFVLAAGFYGLYLLAETIGAAQAMLGVIRYLAMVNMLLAVFNLIPAFPLDGGRMLRAALWHRSGNLSGATKIASRAGTIFGITLMMLGVVNMATGNFIGGLWWILIGLFVQSAATAHYVQLQVRLSLEGEKVLRFMTTDPVTIDQGLSLRELVDEYVYRHHHKMFPVLDGDRLTGSVSTSAIREIPREQWDQVLVRQIMKPLNKENVIDIDADAMTALELMKRSGNSRLIVTKVGQLVGLIALKDLLELFALKMELEKGD
jgi:Zn-dependent protease